MKLRFCMKVPGGYVVAENRFYLDDDGQYCEAPATRDPIVAMNVDPASAGAYLGKWRPESKLYHCVPMPAFKERFPNAYKDS